MLLSIPRRPARSSPSPTHVRGASRWRQAEAHLRAVAPSLAVGTLVYLLARPLLAIAHELTVLATACLLSQVALVGVSASLDGLIPLDPVYTSTVFLLLSNVKVTGVAVAAPLGELLRAAWPAVFSGPDLLVEGAWASAVIEPGASVIARGLVSLSADVAALALGLVLFRLGLTAVWRLPPQFLRLRRSGSEADAAAARGRRLVVRPLSLAVMGALLQGHILLNHLADEPISLADLEATGLTYGFSVLFSGPAAERPRLSTLLLALPEPLRDGLLVGAAIVVAYGLALGLVLGPSLAWRLVGRLRRLHLPTPPDDTSRTVPDPRSRPFGRTALALFALGLVASPLGSLAEASSHYLGDSIEAEPTALAILLPELAAPSSSAPATAAAAEPAEFETAGPHAAREAPTATPAASPTSAPTAIPRPPPSTSVVVAGSNYSYTYRVGGQAQVIRGMGYNPTYATLSAAERAAYYDRDFAAMRQVGVNTILGWVTDEWDGLLLDKAQEHGLGVILPYDLNPDLDYADPLVRDAVERDVVRWVERYKEHPALRMWGLGNEVLHKLVFPSWMKLRGDPLLEARADAFADFYVRLIDQIHRLDPEHPVTYRDAEDQYLPRLRDALAATGVHRPWFVYGINIYTPRLAELIADWPSQGLDAAVLISEFGPGGAGPGDRPRGYRELWAMIRTHPTRVLGGAPYVWNTRGPEEVDRIFGLVDPAGQPVDGSLVAIGRVFRGEASAESEAVAGAERTCSDRVTDLFLKTIHDLRTDPHGMVFQASTPPSIMGPLDTLPADPIRPEDVRFERAHDPARLAYQRASGVGAEWWVTWNPPSRPGDQLALLIREIQGQVEVAYVYHGVSSPAVAAWQC